MHLLPLRRALCLASWLLVATAHADQPSPKARITWSSLGVPHVEASDERGLGYGIGYAYARDNLCLLADEVLTVNGQRAKLLGRAGQSSSGLDNLSSDVYFQWLNSDAQVEAFWAAQPAAMQQRIAGYVAGFNRYLARTPVGQLPEQCANAGWLRPLVTADVVRIVRRLVVEGGVGRFAEALANAAPPRPGAPSAGGEGAEAGRQLAQLEAFAATRGSNAIAVGGARSDNGKGLLLGNPHFPWNGGLRFYQMHLTLPGQLDVMGAALPGLPLVNIGFNQHMAWSHTVDQSSHFTLHRLTLDPHDATRYLVDGQSQALSKTSVQVQVREADGRLVTLSRDLYQSRFGPVVSVPGLLPWDAGQAYALQDVNLGNDRILRQWDAMNRAPSAAALQQAVASIQGIPWVNTLAVDDQGLSLYMNASVIPNVPTALLQQCADPHLLKMGLPGLDGSRSECNWQDDAGAMQGGIVAAQHLPQLLGNQVLQNANDSAWMTRPATPLSGFSPLVSRSDRPLGQRARFALSQLQAHGDGPISAPFLQGLVTGNRVHLADLALDDILAFCRRGPRLASTRPACLALSQWDRHANLDSGLGVVYFQQVMEVLQQGEDPWRQPFLASDPVNTPKGIAWERAEVAKLLQQGLSAASQQVAGMGLPAEARWGDVQRLRQRIGIPGGEGTLGVYNAITTVADGKRLAVTGGSSYIQLVGFDAQGPVARGLLAMSQSSNPASAHFQDQTLLFAAQQWRALPFTPAQIAADTASEVLELAP